MFSFDNVKSYDPEVASAMQQELERQRTHIEHYRFREFSK